jgi:hypothetical protein
MAGFRKNIHKNIKIGLDARVKALSNYSKTSSGELRSPLLGPVSDSDDYALTYEEQTSKSPYVRMISPGTVTTQVLYGTFNATLKQEVEDAFTGLSTGGDSPDFFESVQDRIGPSDTSYYNMDPEKHTGDMAFGRPKPGITSAKVEFIKYGGAVRKATVNWVCFSLDELQMYTEGSFLSAGRNIILDWGWVRSGKGSEQVPKILMVENDKIVLDSRLFSPDIVESNTEGGKKKVKNHPSSWDMLWKEHYGDWGGMIGIISNFSWTMNTDGSFGCMTEIMAKGSSVFDQPIPSPKKEQMSELPMGQQTFDRFMVDLMKDAADGKVDADILAGPALNIKERCNTLDIEILTKCFGNVLEAKAIMRQAVSDAQNSGEDVDQAIEDLEVIELPCVRSAEKNNIVIILRPTKSGTLPEAAGGDLQILEYFDEDPDTLEFEKAVKKAGDISTDIWVRWGWFEDNVVSYYAVERTKESDCAEAEFRSVSTTADETGQLNSVVIANSENLYTIDPNVCLLPGQYPASWHQKPPDEIDGVSRAEIAEKQIYYELAAHINANCEKFAVDSDDWNKGGYLRNIMVNLSQIQAAFSGPGESIQSAMLKLANSLNAGVKVWNFDVDKSDPGDGPTTAITTYFIHTPDSGPEEEEVVEDNSKPENSYVFENNGFNSLVTDINMSSTLPDKFAMMAGYGQTRAEEDSKPSAQTNPDIVRALLRDRGDTSEEAKQAKAMGEFFSNPKNKQVIGTLQKTQSEYAEYGHLDGKNKIGELHETGLSLENGGSQWNHTFGDTLIALNPTSKANYAKQFESKYIDSVSAGQSQIVATQGGEIKALSEQKDLNIMAWPSTDANDPLNKKLRLEFKKPYDQTGKLRSHFISTIKWYHEDSPLTKVGANSKTLTLPITLSMTIDGCSGLFAGNMFRLSYLPAEMYGQTDMNSGARVGSPPKSYFHMNGVSHDISATGWKTEIDATLNKYNPGNVDQENADKQALAKWKEKNAKKLKVKFAENLRKMAIPDENEATGIEIVEGG